MTHDNKTPPSTTPRQVPVSVLRCFWYALVGILLGCGTDAADPAENRNSGPPRNAQDPWVDVRTPAELERPAPYFRVQVTQAEDGSLSATEVTTFLTSLRPMPDFSGEFAAASFGANGTLDAVPFGFRTIARALTDDEYGNLIHEDSEFTAASTAFFLPASANVEGIELYDATGVLVLRIGTSELPVAPDIPASDDFEPPGRYRTSEEPLLASDLALKYPHIRFSGVPVPEQTSARLGTTLELTAERASKLDKALSDLGPLQLSCLQAINIMGVADCPSDAEQRRLGPIFCLPKEPNQRYAKGMDFGTTVALNSHFVDAAPKEPTLSLILNHEATHCIDVLTRPSMFTEWPENVRGALTRLVDTYRLAIGFGDVIDQINTTGIGHNLAHEYVGDQWLDLPYSSVPLGYASVYALNNAADDLAELACTTQLPDQTSEMKPGVCRSFHLRSSTQLAPELAVVYAKLALLRATGVITNERFRECTNPMSLDAPSEGVFFPDVMTFDQNLRAVEQADVNGGLLTVLADGPNSYQVRVDVSYSGATALGVHKLNAPPLFSVPLGESAVYAGSDDVFRARLSSFGLVLVTEHSKKSLRGAILALELSNGGGSVTDYIPVALFNAPLN